MKVDAHNRAISDANSSHADDDSVRRSELSDLIQLHLGHPLDPNVFNTLLAAQAQLRIEQASLTARLEAGALTPDRYLDQLNSALRRWTCTSRNILGPTSFRAVFGDAGEDPDTLIDKETFFRSEEVRRP